MLYIVDDEPDIVALLQDIAKNIFPQIEVFVDSSEFINKKTTSEDIIILDIKMPKMDGVEILRRLAEKDCRSKLILISGFNAGVLHSTAMLGQQLGLQVVAQITKPAEPDEIHSILTKLSCESSNISEITSSNQQAPKKKSFDFSKKEVFDAMKNKQLILHYQPQVNLQTRELISVEALVRWEHPEFGLIFPDDFLPFIEKYKLNGNLTSYVIKMAIEQESDWERYGYDIDISINICASNVTSLSLPEQLEALINKMAIKPSKVCFEVTESELMGELVNSIDTLTRMRLKGFNLSIDDFGTGYSSLLQLYRIPFNELKIDKSFVTNLLSSSESQVIVDTCITLGHKLGMKVVAEGIEDKDTLDALISMGCDIGQGYYISKPLSRVNILYWLHEYKTNTKSQSHK